MFVLAHASSFLLRWLSTRPHVSDVHFFSDSSSSLKVIFKGTPHPSQSTSILFRTNFHHLFSALPNLRVHISWVPGHKGIAGMKIADSLAKKAAKAKGPRLSHAASCSGPLLEIERNAHSRWRDHRESHPFQESSSFFPASQSIRPSLKPPKWFKTISRPDYLHYTQFATGHGYTGEYYSQFVPKNPIHCNCDPSDIPIVQTRDHILHHCPLHKKGHGALRAQFPKLSNPQWSIHRLFQKGIVPLLLSWLVVSSAFSSAHAPRCREPPVTPNFCDPPAGVSL